MNRIYSSEQGRFIQPDPIGMASVDLTDPQTLNLYTYARNNPIDLVDPDGTHPRYTKYYLDGIEVPARMALRALASGSAELPRGYSGPLGYWVDFDDWSKTDEYGFPGTGTTFVSNTLYIQGLLDRTGPSSPVRNTREGFGGGGYSGEDYNLSNSVRESAGAQPKPRGDWRVKALVRGGAPTAEAARPALNVIATVMSFFTSPFVSAAGSGVRLSLGASKGVSVIGPRSTYREFAKKIGANFLDVTDEAWTMRKNVKFLQGVVKRGDDVVFAGKYDPLRLNPKSVLAQEIRYLQRRGYSWNKDFTRLIKK